MPTYRFIIPVTNRSQDVDLPSDQEAWAQAVSYLGELLKDMDGDLPHDTSWQVKVSEGEREVAVLNFDAKRS
jgi:hypothetical protein